MEGNRPWWGGRASNPVGGATRCREGSTPSPFRPLGFTQVRPPPLDRAPQPAHIAPALGVKSDVARCSHRASCNDEFEKCRARQESATGKEASRRGNCTGCGARSAARHEARAQAFRRKARRRIRRQAFRRLSACADPKHFGTHAITDVRHARRRLAGRKSQTRGPGKITALHIEEGTVEFEGEQNSLSPEDVTPQASHEVL